MFLAFLTKYKVQSTKYKVQSTKYKVQSTKYKVQSTKYKVQSTKYKVQSTKYKVQSTKYKVQSTKYKVQSTKYKVQSTKYKVQSTQYTVHSTQYTVQPHANGQETDRGQELVGGSCRRHGMDTVENRGNDEVQATKGCCWRERKEPIWNAPLPAMPSAYQNRHRDLLRRKRDLKRYWKPRARRISQSSIGQFVLHTHGARCRMPSLP